jgi:hypothetical protein
VIFIRAALKEREKKEIMERDCELKFDYGLAGVWVVCTRIIGNNYPT